MPRVLLATPAPQPTDEASGGSPLQRTLPDQSQARARHVDLDDSFDSLMEIAVRAIDLDGNPVPRCNLEATVMISDSAGEPLRSFVLRESGDGAGWTTLSRSTLGMDALLRYVRLGGDLNLSCQLDVWRSDGGAGARFVLDGDSILRPNVVDPLFLAPVAKLRLRVVDPGGEPIVGAGLKTHGSPHKWAHGGTSWSRDELEWEYARTDENGVLILRTLAGDAYYLSHAVGYAPVPVRLRVPPDGLDHLAVLEPLTQLRGAVHGFDGKLHENVRVIMDVEASDPIARGRQHVPFFGSVRTVPILASTYKIESLEHGEAEVPFARVAIRPDAVGRFAVYGVPAGVPVRLRLRSGQWGATTEPIALRLLPGGIRDVVLSLR